MANLGNISIQVQPSIADPTHAYAGEVLVIAGPDHGRDIHPDGLSSSEAASTHAYAWVA